MSTANGRGIRWDVAAAALLFAFVGAEVWLYPYMATWLFRAFTGQPGWDGSSLTYYKFFRVLPGALVFLLVVLVGYRLTFRKAVAFPYFVAIAWLAHVIGLGLSIWIYARLAGVS